MFVVLLFSEKEVDFIQKNGNEEAKKIWLASFDSKSKLPDPKDTSAVKSFIKAKYQEKKWADKPDKKERKVDKNEDKEIEKEGKDGKKGTKKKVESSDSESEEETTKKPKKGKLGAINVNKTENEQK